MTAERPHASSGKPARTGLVLTALCLASFFSALNFFATSPFYPVMSRDLNTTIPLLGQGVTLMVLISAVLGLAVGPLADRYGYRWPLVIGLGAIALNLLGTSLTPNYPVLLLCGIVGGLGDALVFGLSLAIAGSRFKGDEQRRAISWTIAALSAGAIVGVPILTTISGLGGWRIAIAAGGIAAAGTAWFVAIVFPPDGLRPTTRLRIRELLLAYAPIAGHPPTIRLLAVTMFRAIWFLGFVTYTGAFLGDELDFNTRQVGFVYTLGGAGSAIGSFVAGTRLIVMKPHKLAVWTNIAGGVLLVPLLWSATPWVTLPVLPLVGFAASLGGVAIATLLAAESPANAGTTMALNGSLLNTGAAAGAALGGAFIALGGYGGLALGLPVFALAAALLAWWPAAPLVAFGQDSM